MKITSVEAFIVPPRWLFVKISTDEGVSGWGEAILQNRPYTVKAAAEELGSFILGRDPSPIEAIWTDLYRGGFYRGGGILMSALSAIDQALWDIKGRSMGVPVHKLLGGPVRDKIQVYSWIGGDRPSGTAENARNVWNAGFRAVKMNACQEMNYIDTIPKLDAAVAMIAAVREECGPEMNIAVDFHGRVHKGMVRPFLRELEAIRPMFVEEPVLSENYEALHDIVGSTNIPIALGERLFTRWEFKKILSESHVDIIQPDASHAGGITESKKIAAMAEAYDVGLALHCPLGPIALATCLQLDAVCQNAVIQEQSLGIHYNKGNDIYDYLKNPEVLKYENGYCTIPTGPGLGIEINEEYVRERAKIGPPPRRELWRHPDGSFAEW